MERLLIHWLLSAAAIAIVSFLVPGFVIEGPGTALIAAVVIGLVNATLGLFLKIITFPLTIMTLGLFWFIINGVMLELASNFIPGFYIQSFASAFWGAIVLSLVNMVLKHLTKPKATELIP